MSIKPRLAKDGEYSVDGRVIEVLREQAVILRADLAEAGFDAQELEGEFRAGDLNAGSVTDLILFRLPADTDLIAIRKFLREWRGAA